MFLTFHLACPVVHGQVNERTKKVLADRTKITEEGFWIYNDMPAAFAQARANGKPILVMLRCLPCEVCVKLDDYVMDQDPIIRPLLEQFGGLRLEPLSDEDRASLIFDPGPSAMKVKNVGQYGPHAAAKKAVFQVGDIVTDIDGITDIRSETNLLRYGVMERKAGDKIAVTISRGNLKKVLMLPMQK